MEYDYKELSRVLKLAQGEMSQNQFARVSGVQSASLTRIHQGKFRPEPKSIRKLARKARNGVTYEQLMAAAGYIGVEPFKEKEKRPEHEQLLRRYVYERFGQEPNDEQLREAELYIEFLLWKNTVLPDCEHEAMVKNQSAMPPVPTAGVSS